MAKLLDEMDRVVLSEDLADENLKAGSEGLVVDVRQNGRRGYTGPDSYTIEFGRGDTDGVRDYKHVNLRPEQVRPKKERPRAHPTRSATRG